MKHPDMSVCYTQKLGWVFHGYRQAREEKLRDAR